MAAILLSTNRDRVKLQEGGYLYVFDKLSTNGEKKFWRCERKSECNARIHTDAITNVVVKRASEHNHPSHLEVTSSGAVLVGAKRRAYEPIDDVARLDNLHCRVSKEMQLQQQLGHSTPNDVLQKMMQRTKTKMSRVENESSSPTSSGNGCVNENISVGEVFNKDEDGRSMATSDRAHTFMSGTMPVKEEGLNRLPDAYSREASIAARQQTADLRFENASTIADASNTSVVNEKYPMSSPTVPMIAALKPKKTTPQVNVIPIGVDKYLTGGFVCWSQKIAAIVEESELVAKMVAHSQHRSFASILFLGAANTGKSCLAAIATKSIETAMVRLCSGDDVIALTETAKITALRKVVEDTYSTTVNVVMLDNIDRIIDYCAVGPKYSNSVLQALLILLKKTPPPNHRLLIVATASDQCTRAFGLQDFFTAVLDVPPLSTVDHLMTVIEDSDVFSLSDCAKLRTRLSERTCSYAIGIKRLLDLLELAKQRDPRLRIDFVCARLEKMIPP
ncbi:Vesicle-fusing ATPase [Toxocara canis]|uniref:Vesicle-fusing ATPase n=1 Tax=Toxocara canis TaxID=6265 RepID=A0A0B2W3U0_TOXCA|nr:Vesicle-fusing ATPase [Toxocara canis]